MLKITMEFRKGILFVRLDGELTKKTASELENNVIPVVLKHGIRFVVVNLDRVNLIDTKGIEALMELNDVAVKNNGRTTLCSLTSRQVKNSLHSSIYNNKFFETSNELTALGVMRI